MYSELIFIMNQLNKLFYFTICQSSTLKEESLRRFNFMKLFKATSLLLVALFFAITYSLANP
jgi:hypothetical protein